MDRIDVLEFDSQGRMLLINQGDGDVFISHIFLRSHAQKPKFEKIEPINIQIRPGEFKVYIFENEKGKVDFVEHTNDNDPGWNEALRRAFSFGDTCFDIRVLHEGELGFQRARLLKVPVGTFPAEVTVYFYSVKQVKLLSQDFPAVGTVTRKRAEGC